VFHACLAQERGWFDFDAVAAGIHDKLVRRHPHVFSDASFASSQEQTANWEEHKAKERGEAAARRGEESASLLSDVPKSLPALLRAAKLGRRAARVGFDWPDASGVRAKLAEELAELEAAVTSGSKPAIAEEIGDLLFTVVNLGRHLEVDAEETLRAANSKFEARFRRMESLARARALELAALSPQQWDALWMEAKGASKA
jgi:nucleoside triphosphate diphosphatase